MRIKTLRAPALWSFNFYLTRASFFTNQDTARFSVVSQYHLAVAGASAP